MNKEINFNAKNTKGKRIKGNITIEASVVFTFITCLVVLFIRLNFELHDRVVNDSSKFQAGIRNRQAEAYYYDCYKNIIDYSLIIQSPVIGENTKKYDGNAAVRKYYDEYHFSSDKKIDTSNINEVIKHIDNADMIRKTGRAVALFKRKEKKEK